MTKNQKPKKKNKSSSYLNDDENYVSFSKQLEKLSLELRDITGDGNCCFRALSDQMEGNESQHLVYRKQVCQYIRQNRAEFEPFIAALIEEEDGPKKPSKLDSFEQYLKSMEQAGTYADNLCLVAFARLNQLNINIHQISLPIWTISGVNTHLNRSVRELHLSYHNGEHYSSIRPLGDKSKMPTNIFFKSEAKIYNSFINNLQDWNLNDPDELNDKVEQVMRITSWCDEESIRKKLAEFDWDVELTINYFLSNNLDSNTKCKNKKDKKAEKKQKQMERQRNKFIEEKVKSNIESSVPSTTNSSSNLTLSNIQTQAI
ncbi:OTU domain-containing 3 [Brachionus plicatilis]|uniref:OTU domain-containing 3 n=1 Tax=Brachionus plicatilis TaxID=10195 RepID=A0A3M7S0W8_BRAPC|nr:OTU domain-containing 3 [Brachionus plicatilis]